MWLLSLWKQLSYQFALAWSILMRYRCTFIIILNAAICLWASPVWQIHMQLHCKQTHMPSCTVYTDYRSSRAVSMVSLFKIKMNPVILCWRLRQSLFASFHGCPCFCLAVKDTKRTYTTEMTDQTGCHMFLIIIVKHLTFTNILPKHSQLAVASEYEEPCGHQKWLFFILH